MMKIIIIDDDAIVASSMQTILTCDSDVEVLALGYDGKDAITLYKEWKPDIVLMDIQMKEMSGLDASREIKSLDPAAKIILLTTFLDDTYVREALEVGASGYILKQDFSGVLPAIKAVYSGQNVFGNQIVSRIPHIMDEKEKHHFSEHGITVKEYEIIELVAQGLSNKEIANRLFLSEGTVRNYISMVLDKLELRDRTQLAVFYYRN